jgi:hypothetical protein
VIELADGLDVREEGNGNEGWCLKVMAEKAGVV